MKRARIDNEEEEKNKEVLRAEKKSFNFKKTTTTNR
jgi:hypothetical protein